jgi:hypothetical protein
MHFLDLDQIEIVVFILNLACMVKNKFGFFVLRL